MSAEHRLYLLDVEGTVAPLTLTTGQLFPYARAHFEQFLRGHSADPSVQSDLALLAEENRAETDASSPKMLGAPGPSRLGTRETTNAGASGLAPETWESTGMSPALGSALAYLLWLMDRDRKSTALKSLQGKIWKAGFESGELKGTLFADVPQAFARWSAAGKIAIYSSGSVAAQQLLFRHSSYGDLTPRISGYFDTRTGPKTAAASYRAIAAAMQVDPPQALFFSDVVRELDAARDAGFATRLVVREGNPPVGRQNTHPQIPSLDAV